MGLAATGISIVTLSMASLGAIAPGATTVGTGVALFTGGLGQLVAGLLEFRRGETFGGTLGVMFSTFFMAIAGTNLFFRPQGVTGAQIDAAIGIFLLPWAVFTLLLAVVVARTTVAMLVTFGLLSLSLWALVGARLTGDTMLSVLSGYLGVFAGTGTFYLCLAGLLAHTWGREYLPVWPISPPGTPWAVGSPADDGRRRRR